MTYEERRATWSPEYAAFHDRVVEACVKLMGEHVRVFFTEHCDYFESFAEGEDPADVALSQQECVD